MRSQAARTLGFFFSSCAFLLWSLFLGFAPLSLPPLLLHTGNLRLLPFRISGTHSWQAELRGLFTNREGGAVMLRADLALKLSFTLAILFQGSFSFLRSFMDPWMARYGHVVGI